MQASTSQIYDRASHETIFHEIRNSKLPPEEKTTTRLWQDGQVTVVAGTLTTAWSFSVSTYHLLTLPRVLRKLKAELERAIPDANAYVPLSTLEQLPYLTACVQEGLRLSCGVSSRLQRVCPDEDLIFRDGKKRWVIPRNTPVAMTSLLLHYDEAVFPDPTTFTPERWLENPRLDKYLIAFSRGSRQCIGINLAYAEIYLGLATIFRRYGSVDVRNEKDLGILELYETSKKDIEIIGDGITPLVSADSKGIRVEVRQ
jgi:cytochrome P450